MRKLKPSEVLDKIDSTEILSIGIQRLVTDPVDFKTKDIVYYNFICQILGNVKWGNNNGQK